MNRTLLGVLFLIAFACWLVGGSWFLLKLLGVESPSYRVVERDGKVEFRDYPDLVLASTPIPQGMNEGMGHLYLYLNGDNIPAVKIAMTTPMWVERKGDVATLNFILPRAMVAKGVPAPKSDQVHIVAFPAGHFAALRFSGKRSVALEAEAAGRLLAWTDARHLRVDGEPFFAYYDSPWIPIFLRRTEVLVRLASKETSAEEPPKGENTMAR